MKKTVILKTESGKSIIIESDKDIDLSKTSLLKTSYTPNIIIKYIDSRDCFKFKLSEEEAIGICNEITKYIQENDERN